jgi:predicted  nucleic acid-binding Zn-ribbon protein
MPGFDLNFGSGEDDTEEMMAQYEHELDSMKNIIGVYMDENAQLNLRINDLNGQIEDLEYTVRRRENTIANLKKETNEKVTAVSKFNSTDIYKFLSDRYKDSTQVK